MHGESGLGIVVADGVCRDAVQFFCVSIVPIVVSSLVECARIARNKYIVCDGIGGSMNGNIILIVPDFVLSRACCRFPLRR